MPREQIGDDALLSWFGEYNLLQLCACQEQGAARSLKLIRPHGTDQSNACTTPSSHHGRFGDTNACIIKRVVYKPAPVNASVIDSTKAKLKSLGPI